MGISDASYHVPIQSKFDLMAQRKWASDRLKWRDKSRFARDQPKDEHLLCSLIPAVAALTNLIVDSASAGTVNAVWNSATDAPVTANGYTAAGRTVSFTLQLRPGNGRRPDGGKQHRAAVHRRHLR